MIANSTQSEHVKKLQSTRIDPSRFNRPNAGTVSKMNVGANGQVIDENYLNQKIMYLN